MHSLYFASFSPESVGAAVGGVFCDVPSLLSMLRESCTNCKVILREDSLSITSSDVCVLLIYWAPGVGQVLRRGPENVRWQLMAIFKPPCCRSLPTHTPNPESNSPPYGSYWAISGLDVTPAIVQDHSQETSHLHPPAPAPSPASLGEGWVDPTETDQLRINKRKALNTLSPL